MNSNLEFISTTKMTPDQWLKYRKSGIGASEVGAILGLSPYKSSIELFYEKIGDDIGFKVENIFMFMGKEQEAFIANLWQYWDGSEESMIYNYRNGNIVRRCQRVRAYVRNPKYPWLFVSLDRKINRYADRGEGALEIKTIGGYEADKWEGGIPPSHVVQVQTQCKVCEFVYGELATLKDGRRFDVIPFDISQDLTETIIEQTHDFWKRIVRGREIINQRFNARRNYNQIAIEELTSELATLEPEPDGSDTYSQFLSARAEKTTAGEKAGTITQLQDAIKHQDTGIEIATLTETRRLFENKLKKSLGDFTKLDFGKRGFVTWKPDVNGNRRFVNKVK
jgi:putative phage-type endonuclease